ncbi:phage tail sheath family protein [Actinomadura miaoliensis]|uniref:Phage tail sheath family protein n=1 Tax=Actinomadura miaoliensis TaxID=430685 RepID=A0ABP7WS56_9ACTN
MPNPTYPGVYVQEVAGGARPIEAVSTSTPAFVGLAEMGPDDTALRVTSWIEYQRFYGSFVKPGYLAESVFQFFNNGGRQCYVVRVTRGDAAAASVTVQNTANPPVPGIVISARSKGAWANRLVLTTEDGSADPGNEFRISVRRQDDTALPEDLAGTPPLEVHDNLSMDPDAPNFVTQVLRANSDLIDAKVLSTNTSLQRGRHRGGKNPQLPLQERRSFLINVDNDGYQQVDLPDAVAASTDPAEIAAAIQTAVRNLTILKAGTPAAAFNAFTCTVEGTGADAALLLQSGTGADAATASKGSSVLVQPARRNDAAVRLRLGEGGGGVSQNALAVRRPPGIAALRLGVNARTGPVTDVRQGTDGTAAPSFTDAFPRLDQKTDFSLLAVPGENTPQLVDEGLRYCENRPLRDVFYLGEMARNYVTADAAETFRKRLTKPNSYGALYFPWIKALDPSGVSAEPVLLPPSGYIAGLYARIDANRGVWKAPAGTSASLGGAVGLAVELTDVDHGNLNPLGVNVIRRFPAAGIVAFGARTISSDPEWKYVPVRRMAIMLRVSVYHGIQWAVFEPNDEVLWAQLRQNIGAFMMTLFRQGAFQGATPSEAFFVKCDGETTTQADIDLGVVNVLLGFAPLKPAEFVVVKVSQQAGQAH